MVSKHVEERKIIFLKLIARFFLVDFCLIMNNIEQINIVFCVDPELRVKRKSDGTIIVSVDVSNKPLWFP